MGKENKRRNKVKNYAVDGKAREREYYEWLVANAFVNNNKINGYDNNILARSFLPP